MNRITKVEFFEGVNFKQDFSYAMILKLMNSNAQFIIDMCIDLQMLF
jgi:hypothetical protein